MKRSKRRPLIEIPCYFIIGCLVWFGLLGGSLGGGTTAEPIDSALAPTMQPTQMLSPSPSALPQEAVPLPSPVASQASTTSPPTLVASTTSWGLPTWLVIVLLIAVIVTILTFAGIFAYFWYRKTFIAPLATAEGAIIETTGSSSTSPIKPVVASRQSTALAHTSHRPGATQQHFAAVAPIVESTPTNPFRWLKPHEVLQALTSLGYKQDSQPTADPIRRIYALMQRLKATEVSMAPNHIVVIFPNLAVQHELLGEIAHPNPAIQTADGQGNPMVVIGLWHKSITSTTNSDPVAAPEVSLSTSPQRSWTTIVRPLRISDDLPLSLDSIASEVWFFGGQRRAGKSYTLGVICEELCEHVFPFALIDLEGEAFGLRASYHLLIVGKSIRTTVDREVAPSEAYNLALWAFNKGRQLICDLSGMSEDDQRLFIANFANGLWDAAIAAVDKRMFTLILDEAHVAYPQVGKTVASDSIDRLVLRGGKWGIGIGLATQSPANCHINGRKQASVAVLHRVEQARDIKAYADLLPARYTEAWIAEAVQQLQQGMAIAKIASANNPTIVQQVRIRTRRTPHIGSSPKVGSPVPTPPELVPLPPALLADFDSAHITATASSTTEEVKHQTPELSLVSRPDQSLPVPGTPTIDLTALSKDELIHAFTHPDSPVGIAAREWLVSIQACALRPHDLVTAGPHKLPLEECAKHPVVERAVIEVYTELKPRLGKKLSGRQITAQVFESAPGKKDGNTSTRWTDVVRPILERNGLELPTMDTDSESDEDVVLETGVKDQADQGRIAA